MTTIVCFIFHFIFDFNWYDQAQRSFGLIFWLAFSQLKYHLKLRQFPLKRINRKHNFGTKMPLRVKDLRPTSFWRAVNRISVSRHPSLNAGEGGGSCQLGINRRCRINPTFKSAEICQHLGWIHFWKIHFLKTVFSKYTFGKYTFRKYTFGKYALGFRL